MGLETKRTQTTDESRGSPIARLERRSAGGKAGKLQGKRSAALN